MEPDDDAAAQYNLKEYVYTTASLLKDYPLFWAGDKGKIEAALKDAHEWLDNGWTRETADKDQYEAKQKELEGIVKPVLGDLRRVVVT